MRLQSLILCLFYRTLGLFLFLLSGFVVGEPEREGQTANNTIMASSQSMMIDNHPLHYATWGDKDDQTKPWVILLSGPIDSWHSDSAWFGALTPALSNHFRVIAIDRAGQVNGVIDAPVGYAHFANDLQILLQSLQIKNASMVAFASGNVTAQLLLQNGSMQSAISSAVLIDPDVLTEFSIARYSADAKPFKDNLKRYQDYIKSGKYTQRVKQKNQADHELLEKLNTSSAVDWSYVDKIMAARLDINNQLNMFSELAIYSDDLNLAAKHNWPKTIPTIVIDTQFEQTYIDTQQDSDIKKGLIDWKQDAKGYYQSISSLNPSSKYIEVQSTAHLFQFENPEQVLALIESIRQ